MDAKEEECRRFWRLERVAFLIEVVGVGGEDIMMGRNAPAFLVTKGNDICS